MSALSYAISGRKHEMVAFLIEKGASPQGKMSSVSIVHMTSSLCTSPHAPDCSMSCTCEFLT